MTSFLWSRSSAQGGDRPPESWRGHGQPYPKPPDGEQGKEGPVREGSVEALEQRLEGQQGSERAVGERARSRAPDMSQGRAPGALGRLQHRCVCVPASCCSRCPAAEGRPSVLGPGPGLCHQVQETGPGWGGGGQRPVSGMAPLWGASSAFQEMASRARGRQGPEVSGGGGGRPRGWLGAHCALWSVPQDLHCCAPPRRTAGAVAFFPPWPPFPDALSSLKSRSSAEASSGKQDGLAPGTVRLLLRGRGSGQLGRQH